MHLTFDGKTFVFRCNFDSRHVAKEAGFFFQKHPRLGAIWVSDSPGAAARLRDFADDKARAKIDSQSIVVKPWTGQLKFPNHLQIFPHQREAAHFALSRNRAYLGLDPGLGKTIVAALIANSIPDVCVFYVCPPFLIPNVKAEFAKWTKLSVVTFENHKEFTSDHMSDVNLIPDSLLTRPALYSFVSKSFAEFKKSKLGEVVMFIDEAHRFKNQKAGRTEALLYGEGEKAPLFTFADRVFPMSGTPMPNRPIELYPILSKLAPETIDFRSFFSYATKYCGAFEGAFGWDYSGASNIDELKSRVHGHFMLRQKKDLLNLPPVTNEVVVIDSQLPPKFAKLENSILSELSFEDLTAEGIEAKLREELGKDDYELHLATYRRELGSLKLETALPFIESILEETDEKILVFLIHRDVLEKSLKHFKKYNPLHIDGSVPTDKRFETVKAFERGESRIMILNITAGGVGFNLTSATRVVFLEFSWVPGENEQARDRAHRIGQTKNVLCQYLVFGDSIDSVVIGSLLKKSDAIRKI